MTFRGYDSSDDYWSDDNHNYLSDEEGYVNDCPHYQMRFQNLPFNVPSTWLPIISTKVEATIVEDIANTIASDFNTKLRPYIANPKNSIDELHVPSVETSITPYILIGGDEEDYYDWDSNIPPNVKWMANAEDVCFVYSENKKFVLSFVNKSLLTGRVQYDIFLRSDFFLRDYDTSESDYDHPIFDEFIKTVEKGWKENAITFTDLRSEENELILNHIEYDIGTHMKELDILNEPLLRSKRFVIRYVFHWTKPGKYTPPRFDDNSSGGRGFEKAKTRYVATSSRINKKTSRD